MLHLILHRLYKKNDYTIGKLFNGNIFICNTLEDTDRQLNQFMTNAEISRHKISNQTAIPIGTYKLSVSMSPKFGRRLVEVQSVPGFSGIRIHRGNSAADSAGCILPGLNSEKGRVTQSSYFEQLLTQLVEGAINKGEQVFLTIV